MREIKQIIIHCSATPPHRDIGAEEIRRWHVQDNGWSDIGYHYVIRRDGELELGRDLDGDGNVDEEVGAHAKGFNAHSIGICLIGGTDHKGNPDTNFTRRQWRALDAIVGHLAGLYPGAEVIGHRDVDPGKECPSFDVKAYYAGGVG